MPEREGAVRTAGGAQRPFSVLLVCTGNICRSPLAEAALQRGLADHGSEQGPPLGPASIAVTSAGTRAEPGAQSPDDAKTTARRSGLDLDAHRARELTAGLLAESDLVLGLDRSHRRAVVSLAPRASRNTFTLLEFARVCDSLAPSEVSELREAAPDGPARLRAAVATVAALRGTLPAAADELDVPDPYRRGLTAYEVSSAAILPACEVITRFFTRLTD